MSAQIMDRHYVIPLADNEVKDIRRESVEADLSVKEWMRIAVMERLYTIKGKRED